MAVCPEFKAVSVATVSGCLVMMKGAAKHDLDSFTRLYPVSERRNNDVSTEEYMD